MALPNIPYAPAKSYAPLPLPDFSQAFNQQLKFFSELQAMQKRAQDMEIARQRLALAQAKASGSGSAAPGTDTIIGYEDDGTPIVRSVQGKDKDARKVQEAQIREQAALERLRNNQELNEARLRLANPETAGSVQAVRNDLEKLRKQTDAELDRVGVKDGASRQRAFDLMFGQAKNANEERAKEVANTGVFTTLWDSLRRGYNTGMAAGYEALGSALDNKDMLAQASEYRQNAKNIEQQNAWLRDTAQRRAEGRSAWSDTSKEANRLLSAGSELLEQTTAFAAPLAAGAAAGTVFSPGAGAVVGTLGGAAIGAGMNLSDMRERIEANDQLTPEQKEQAIQSSMLPTAALGAAAGGGTALVPLVRGFGGITRKAAQSAAKRTVLRGAATGGVETSGVMGANALGQNYIYSTATGDESQPITAGVGDAMLSGLGFGAVMGGTGQAVRNYRMKRAGKTTDASAPATASKQGDFKPYELTELVTDSNEAGTAEFRRNGLSADQIGAMRKHEQFKAFERDVEQALRQKRPDKLNQAFAEWIESGGTVDDLKLFRASHTPEWLKALTDQNDTNHLTGSGRDIAPRWSKSRLDMFDRQLRELEGVASDGQKLSEWLGKNLEGTQRQQRFAKLMGELGRGRAQEPANESAEPVSGQPADIPGTPPAAADSSAVKTSGDDSAITVERLGEPALQSDRQNEVDAAKLVEQRPAEQKSADNGTNSEVITGSGEKTAAGTGKSAGKAGGRSGDGKSPESQSRLDIYTVKASSSSGRTPDGRMYRIDIFGQSRVFARDKDGVGILVSHESPVHPSKDVAGSIDIDLPTFEDPSQYTIYRPGSEEYAFFDALLKLGESETAQRVEQRQIGGKARPAKLGSRQTQFPASYTEDGKFLRRGAVQTPERFSAILNETLAGMGKEAYAEEKAAKLYDRLLQNAVADRLRAMSRPAGTILPDSMRNARIALAEGKLLKAMGLQKQANKTWMLDFVGDGQAEDLFVRLNDAASANTVDGAPFTQQSLLNYIKTGLDKDKYRYELDRNNSVICVTG